MYFVLWLRRTMTSSSAKSSLCVEFYLLCTFVDNCCERGKKGRWMEWGGEIVPSSNPQPSTQRTLSFHPRNAYLTIKQKNEIRKRKIMMQRKRKPNQSKPNEEGKPQTKEKRNSSKIKLKKFLAYYSRVSFLCHHHHDIQSIISLANHHQGNQLVFNF